jgi:hypothetical protein
MREKTSGGVGGGGGGQAGEVAQTMDAHINKYISKPKRREKTRYWHHHRDIALLLQAPQMHPPLEQAR